MLFCCYSVLWVGMFFTIDCIIWRPLFVILIFHAFTLGVIFLTPIVTSPALASRMTAFLTDLYFEKPIFARISVSFISSYLLSR